MEPQNSKRALCPWLTVGGGGEDLLSPPPLREVYEQSSRDECVAANKRRLAENMTFASRSDMFYVDPNTSKHIKQMICRIFHTTGTKKKKKIETQTEVWEGGAIVRRVVFLLPVPFVTSQKVDFQSYGFQNTLRQILMIAEAVRWVLHDTEPLINIMMMLHFGQKNLN